MPSPHRRVVLVEDHQVIRAAIVTLIRSPDDLDVCGSATTAEEALERLLCDADPVLVDVSLPGMSGIDFIREARTRWPEPVYVSLSGHSEERDAVPARAVGAADYVMKGDATALTCHHRRPRTGAWFFRPRSCRYPRRPRIDRRMAGSPRPPSGGDVRHGEPGSRAARAAALRGEPETATS